MSYLNATTGIVDAVTKVKDSHRGNLLLGIAMFLVGTTVVAVYDITGKLILEEKSLLQNNLKLTLSTLSPGIFFVQVKSEEAVFIQKFVKN